jgi:hypothetical protein
MQIQLSRRCLVQRFNDIGQAKDRNYIRYLQVSSSLPHYTCTFPFDRQVCIVIDGIGRTCHFKSSLSLGVTRVIVSHLTYLAYVCNFLLARYDEHGRRYTFLIGQYQRGPKKQKVHIQDRSNQSSHPHFHMQTDSGNHPASQLPSIHHRIYNPVSHTTLINKQQCPPTSASQPRAAPAHQATCSATPRTSNRATTPLPTPKQSTTSSTGSASRTKESSSMSGNVRWR